MLRWWTKGGLTTALALMLITLCSGVGVYLLLSSHRTTGARVVKRPTDVNRPAADAPINHLPGTIYLIEKGALYQLRAGTYSMLLPPAGWTQPSTTAGAPGLLLAKRDAAYSDLYLMGSDGKAQTQLTHNANRTLEANHWAFYPRFSQDGTNVFFSYDSPKFGYEVDLSVWSMPLSGSIVEARKWTTPSSYTGGDVEPVPLLSGALLYAKYSIVDSEVLAQLWVMDLPGGQGRPLTTPQEDCSQAALSPDGRQLAMVCSGDRQSGTLMVAPFAGDTIGPLTAVVAGGELAEPTWAPDSSGLVYLAPSATAGPFQLWWVGLPNVHSASPAASPLSGQPEDRTLLRPQATGARPTAPAPPGPIQLTSSLDFDATSTIAWQ